jgi:hypothetical protein
LGFELGPIEVNMGRLVALPTNIRQGWKGHDNKSLDLYDTAIITGVKCFTIQAPDISRLV